MEKDQSNKQKKTIINNVNSNEQSSGLFNTQDENINSNFANDYQNMDSNNNRQTETGNVNSLKKNESDTLKILPDSTNKKQKPSSKKNKKKMKKNDEYKQNSGMNLKESEDENSDLSDEIIKKSSYSNGLSNRQKKIKKNNNKLNKEDIDNDSTKDTTKKDNFSNDSRITYLNDFKIRFEKFEEKKKKTFYEKSLNKSISNQTICINSIAKEVYNYELKYICYENLKGIDFKNKEILKENYIDLFLGKFSILSDEVKKEAKKEIEILLNKDNEKNKNKFKKLNSLFYEKIEDKFIKYLTNLPYISNGKAHFLIKEYKTFKDDLNEYNKEQIINIHILLNSKITKINYSNSNKKIFNAAMKSINSDINNITKNKYNQSITPTLSYICKYTITSYNEIFKEKLKFIYSNIIPKRKINGKNYSIKIDQILDEEKKEEKEENRILNALLNFKTIKDILRAFVNDEKIIKMKDENGKEYEFILNKTYSDEIFKDWSEAKREIYKKDFIDLLDGNKKPRKISEIRNSKLKNNKNLGRKRKID